MSYPNISSHLYIDGEVNFGPEQFEFSEGRTITCKTINAIDDGVSDGTQTSQLIIDVLQGTSVPVVIHPGSIPITIMDNDGEYTHTVCKLKQTPQAQLFNLDRDRFNLVCSTQHTVSFPTVSCIYSLKLSQIILISLLGATKVFMSKFEGCWTR